MAEVAFHEFESAMAFCRSFLSQILLSLVIGVACFFLLGTPSALAVLNDDHYDGNIYPLYAGNGYLVPPRVTLAQSLKTEIPTILVLYIDDSSDCKQFAPVVSQVDAFYGRVANILPVSVDTLPIQAEYAPTDPAYYYKGLVPQTIVFDQAGKVVLNETGAIAFEKIDDVLRQVFDLLPRSESSELRRRVVNEINTELVPN